MFLAFVAVAYFLPSIYLYFRMKNAFIPKGYKVLFSILYIGMVLFIPVATILFRDSYGVISNLSVAAANYLLVFLLYLLLPMLLFDLFLLVNSFTKMVSQTKLKSSSFKTQGLISIIALSILVVAGGIIHFHTIRTKEYQVVIPRQSAKKETLKIGRAHV